MFGKIGRPVAEVFLKSKNGDWYPFFMYIDSGADISLLPKQLWKSLGFDIDQRKIQEIKGIGKAAIQVCITTAKMKIGGKEFNFRVALSLTEEVPIILGRSEVFDNFKIIFDQRKKIVTFEY